MIHALWALIRRDWGEALSYKSGLISRLGALISFLISAYFIAKTFEGQGPSAVRGAGGYFGFLVSGIAVADLSAAALSGASGRLRQAQLLGTLAPLYHSLGARLLPLEALAVSIGAVARLTIYLALAALLGAPPQIHHPGAALLTLALGLAALLPLGLIGASLTLLLKRGDPLGQAVQAMSLIASGVAYPTEVLPRWLAALGEALPLTHLLRAARAVALRGADLGEVAAHLWALAAFALVGAALAWWACRAADRLARRLGSLHHY
ncbi:ABC transporter permease [Myxococcota bacterium]|nr:ABC transporter permease [Myxococcota bacterium]